MYNYAASISILDGVSNIYMLSIATVLLAVIIALYCANFLKDNQYEKQGDVVDGTTENTEECDDSEQAAMNQSGTDDQIETDAHDESSSDGMAYVRSNNNNKCMSDKKAEPPTFALNRRAQSNSSRADNSDTDSDASGDGLVAKLKTRRLKELEAQLTRDQLEEERRIERAQLAAIFALLKKQEAELNMKEIDEQELNAQFSLYR